MRKCQSVIRPFKKKKEDVIIKSNLTYDCGCTDCRSRKLTGKYIVMYRRIIMSFATDDIWNDQSLTLDSDLPPGWRTIRDSSGTYYWHVPSGTTQWQHPSYSTEDEQSISNELPANQLKVSVLSEVTVLQSTLCACFCVCKDGTLTRSMSHPTSNYTLLHQIHTSTFPVMCRC